MSNKNSKTGKYFIRQIVELGLMVIIAVSVLASLLFVFNSYLGTEAPVAVTTMSMHPVYSGFDPIGGYPNSRDSYYYLTLSGDMLVIKKELPKLGDVIVYQKPGTNDIPIVHRVIMIEEDNNGTHFYLTKGDNNKITDYQGISFGWLTENDVIGVVVLRLPWVGWLSLEIQNSAMRLFLLACIVVILLLMLFEDEEDKKDSDNENESDKSNKSFFTKFRIYITNIIPKTKKRINNINWKRLLFNTPMGNLFSVMILVIVLFTSFSTITAMNSLDNPIAIYVDSNTGQVPYTGGLLNSNLNPIETISRTNLPINGPNFYFIPFYLKLQSNGIFNWLDKIELRFNNTSSDIKYVWSIKYSYNEQFNGPLMIKSGIPLNSTGTGIFNLKLIYTLHYSGLLAHTPIIKEFNVQFQIE